MIGVLLRPVVLAYVAALLAARFRLSLAAIFAVFLAVYFAAETIAPTGDIARLTAFRKGNQ